MNYSNLHTFVILAYKESRYLDDCIKSIVNQSIKSSIVIATTTDNSYIRNLAKKYDIQVVVGKHTNIGGDFDFAVNTGKTNLVTVAHQDDLYDYNYAKTIIDEYNRNKNATIIFTDYYEIRDKDKVYKNSNLKIKRFLLLPLRFKKISGFKFMKRLVLRFGNSICCPAVTFVKNNCPSTIFESEYTSNVDWIAWERLSKTKGKFIYINQCLMGHRISGESTTTDIINQGIRTKEDYELLCKFWPKSIAKIINKGYKKSEKSNYVINK